MTWLFAGLLLAVQSGGWSVTPTDATVGDTVVIGRTLPVAAGARVRAGALAASDLVEPLGAPAVTPTAVGVRVSYVAAFFRPGRHAVAMPEVEIVTASGAVETVVGDTALVRIASVLPDTTAAPRGSRAPVVRPPRRLTPVLLLLGVVLGLTGGWAVLRWRRGPRPPAPPPPPEPDPRPVLRWLQTGETRAAAAVAVDRLRANVAALVPPARRTLSTEELLALLRAERSGWPLRTLSDLLHDLDRARFAPLSPSDAGELTDRAELMLEELARLAEAEAVEERDTEIADEGIREEGREA